jgi:hypothetical protein
MGENVVKIHWIMFENGIMKHCKIKYFPLNCITAFVKNHLAGIGESFYSLFYSMDLFVDPDISISY